MSSGTASRDGLSAGDVVDALRAHAVYLALGLLMAFMLWVRLRPIDRFRGHDPLQWQAVDSYYHWRTTEWTVRNYPFTMPYDVFTGFPSGRYVGQFGTLFDQVIATIAMVIGLGSPDAADILLAGLIGVPLIATAVAIPVFLIGRRLGSPVGALAGVAILALTPGQFLSRSMTGMFQHHAAEVLMMAVSILALMVALRVAEREQPVWELVLDRDWAALRRPFLASAAAGLAIGLYVWVWPPAVVLIGIVGVFFVVGMVVEHVRGASPEPLAFVAAVSMLVAAVMAAGLIEEWSSSVTALGYLQPVAALLVAAGALFMAAVSRVWYRRGLEPLGYPAAVGAAILVAFGGLFVLAPDLYGTLVGNLTGRLLPIDPSVTAGTVAEARPPSEPLEFFYDEYGLAFYTFLLGLAALIARPFIGRTYRVEHVLVVVWALFLISMATTQIRFSYYLVLAVAVVNAYLVAEVLRLVDLPTLENVREIQGYQVLTLVLVVIVLFVPMLHPVATTSAIDVSDAAHPSSDGVAWASSNAFLADNTPAVGDWGGAGNADDLDPWGTYSHPGNGHDYPPGSYGVMSWWDYGHLITTHGERIPHANPFQQNARSAAHYLLATSEEAAELHLDAIAASGDGVSTNDPDALEDIIADHGGVDADREMRYVMIDDQMAAFNPGKMQAIVQWTDDRSTDFFTTQEFNPVDPFTMQARAETIAGPGMSEHFESTMLNRLYFEDATGLEHYRLVHESEDQMAFGTLDLGQGNALLNTRLTAPVAELGGLAPIQLAAQQPDIPLYDVREAARVKTFERVDGALLTGTADDPDAAVVVEVDVTTNADREFVYRTVVEPDDDGHFEARIPYATEFDRAVDDGYTDPAVETGDFAYVSEVSGLDDAVLAEADERGERVADVAAADVTHIDRVVVPESAVYDGETIDVELAERPAFEITAVDAPESAPANETFEIAVEVTNTGDVPDRQPVTLLLGGDELDLRSLELGAGETDTVTFETERAETGEVTYRLTTVADEQSVTVTITEDEGDDDSEAWLPPPRLPHG